MELYAFGRKDQVMTTNKPRVVMSLGNKIGLLIALLSLLSACSRIQVEAARTLGEAGREVALQARQNILVSDQEYLRARDSEAIIHGFNETTASEEYVGILKLYHTIHLELSTRSAVFQRLADLYNAFGELAGLDAGGQTEKALKDLGGAVGDYAKLIKRASPAYDDATAALSRIGGLTAAEIQKKKIKEASLRIRGRVEDIQGLLENSLVREQMTGFHKLLASVRSASLILLWRQGLFDPAPLLDDFGEEVGLAVKRDAVARIKPDEPLGKALAEVIARRLEMKAELIEKSYDTSLSSLADLIAEHKKLEKGDAPDLARIRAIAAELRTIADMFSTGKTEITDK